MDQKRIEMMGAYSQAMLDSAQVRGELTPQTAQTLINGLVDLWANGQSPGFAIPTFESAKQQMDPLEAADRIAEREQQFHKGFARRLAETKETA